MVLNTGWHGYHESDAETFMLRYPGLDKSAVDWLVQRKVAWVGSDTPSPDHAFCLSRLIQAHRSDVFTEEVVAKIDRARFPPAYCHRTLLSNNVPMIEQLGGSIDAVTNKRVTLFALPPKLKRSEASQIRVIAVSEE